MNEINKVMSRMTGEHYMPDHGWDNIIINLDKKLSRIDPDYRIFQIKEKFGTLRFYFDTDIDNRELREVMNVYVRSAEYESSVTCEMCGEDAQLRKELIWRKTLCSRCYSSISRYNGQNTEKDNI